MNHKETNEVLFSSLVVMLHTATMQQLGKIQHPVTGKIERQLSAAQDTIALLDMLQAKTAGNLTPEENQLLTQVIAELKLNYVDEMNKPEQPAAGGGEKTP